MLKIEEKKPVTMRTPIPENLINKLPKPTKAQTDEVRADYTKGIRCTVCGGWHHKNVVHLDYFGHAALTDRLLDVDPAWNWEPLSFDSNGLPSIDKDGGLWIRLTVLGVSRLGYGDAQGKTGGDAMKERIGDALRNAAMRFGTALELWFKGDLHREDDDGNAAKKKEANKPEPKKIDSSSAIQAINECESLAQLQAVWSGLTKEEQRSCDAAKDAAKTKLLGKSK